MSEKRIQNHEIILQRWIVPIRFSREPEYGILVHLFYAEVTLKCDDEFIYRYFVNGTCTAPRAVHLQSPANFRIESRLVKSRFEMYIAQKRSISDHCSSRKHWNFQDRSCRHTHPGLLTCLVASAHGGDIFKNLTFEEKIYINPVRDPQDVPKVRLSAASLAFRVYRMVLEQYLPSELDDFNKKYSNEWRARFFKEYSITISPIDTII